MAHTDEKIKKTTAKEYSAILAKNIKHLAECQRSMIVVLEGYDASGKSGCAERIVRFMEQGEYTVCHTAAPNAEELKYCYLKRFWDQIPPAGALAVFDRSWYGRVLVERVEGLCTEAEWSRAYGEINDFERYLTANGAILLKFWLDVSEEEQLERFRRRAADPAKRHKITEDDWVNRSKRELYDSALCDMISYTDTESAKWHVVPANDKKAARRAVLKLISEALGEALCDIRGQ